jgi:hypothetical protein
MNAEGGRYNKAPAFSGNFSYVSDLRVACTIPFRRISLGEFYPLGRARYQNLGTRQHGLSAIHATWAPCKLLHKAAVLLNRLPATTE